jgi:hypothetical protein
MQFIVTLTGASFPSSSILFVGLSARGDRGSPEEEHVLPDEAFTDNHQR